MPDDVLCKWCESVITNHWINDHDTAWKDEFGRSYCLDAPSGAHEPPEEK